MTNKETSIVKGQPCVVCGGLSGEKKINELGEVRHAYTRNCCACMFTGRPASKLVIGPGNKVTGVHETVLGYDTMPEFGFNDALPTAK